MSDIDRMPQIQPIDDLPRRARGTSTILQVTEAEPRPAPEYSEEAVANEFARAGFTLTEAYVPRHSDDREHMAATKRDPEQAVRMVRAAGSTSMHGGVIPNSYELGVALGHRRGQPLHEDSARLGNIDRATRNDWGNIDQNTERAAARKEHRRQKIYTPQISHPAPQIPEAKPKRSIAPKSHRRLGISKLWSRGRQ